MPSGLPLSPTDLPRHAKPIQEFPQREIFSYFRQQQTRKKESVKANFSESAE
jgi:hypothetical protein